MLYFCLIISKKKNTIDQWGFEIFMQFIWQNVWKNHAPCIAITGFCGNITFLNEYKSWFYQDISIIPKAIVWIAKARFNIASNLIVKKVENM